MTKDDIIRMAEAADEYAENKLGKDEYHPDLLIVRDERFAELLEAKVRADEREAIIKATIDQGFVGQEYADDFAAAIRARGEK